MKNELTSGEKLLSEVMVYSNAGAGVIHVRAKEVARAYKELRDGITQKGYECNTWNVVTGSHKMTVEDVEATAIREGDANPDFQGHIINLFMQTGDEDNEPKDQTFHIYVNADRWFEEPATEYVLQQLARDLPATLHRIIFITADNPLPESVSDLMVSVEMTTPTYKEIQASYTTLVGELDDEYLSTLKVSEDGVERICKAGSGLTFEEFETYLSEAFVRSMVDIKDRDVTHDDLLTYINKSKTFIVNKSDLLELYPAESMDNVGGLDNVKEWVAKRKGCFSEEASELGIEAPKGILLTGISGNGKSLLAKSVANVLGTGLVKLDFGKMFNSFVGKSVAPNEEITLYDEGVFIRLSIEDAYNKYGDTPTNIKTFTYTDDMLGYLAPVTSIIRHEPEHNMIRVTTRSGRSVEVTKDHAVFTLGTRGLTSVRGVDISVGDSIAVPLGDNYEGVDSLCLLDYITDYSGWFVCIEDCIDKKSVLEAIDQKSRGRAKSGGNFKLAIAMANGGVVDTAIIGGAGFTPKDGVPIRLDITDNLARLFGLFMAEGGVNTKQGKEGYTCFSPRLSVHSDEVVEAANLLRLCGYPFKVYETKGSLGATINFCGSSVGRMLDALGLRHNSKQVRLPTWIHYLPKRILGCFINGLFSGDGSFVSGRVIEYSSSLPKFIIDVQNALGRLGVMSSRTYKDIGGYESWRLTITNTAMLYRYYLHCGFMYKIKQDKLAQYVGSLSDNMGVVVPLTESVRDYIRKVKRGKYKIDHKPYATTPYKNRESIKSNTLNTYAKNANSELYNVSGVLPIDWQVGWDVVVSVHHIVPDNMPYVYDLSVPDTERFIAGHSGIIVHNSEERIRKALKLAETLAPCTILIEEIEKNLGGGAGGDAGTSKRVLATFLTWMQDCTKPVFVVASANDVTQLPPELTRKGRLDQIFFVGLPTATEKCEILKIHLKKRGYGDTFTDEEIESLVGSFDGFVGAEIEAVVKEALIEMFSNGDKTLKVIDIVKASKTIVPLSKSHAKVVADIIAWGSQNAIPASKPEGDKPKRKVRRTRNVSSIH